MTKPSWALLLAFCIPSFAAPPAWLSIAVIYEVFPRDFSPSGDLNGVTAGLPRLHELGVDVVWLMPIHPIGQVRRKGTLGSPYSVRDYYAINPDYGTKDDLKRLVTEAHRLGMKVIIDIVANHTAWDSVMMKTPEFYKHNAQGQIIPPVPDWDDVAGLNYANPQLRTYMIDMLRYWVARFRPGRFPLRRGGHGSGGVLGSGAGRIRQAEAGYVVAGGMRTNPPLMAKAFDLDYAWPLHARWLTYLPKGEPARALRTMWEEERRQYAKGALHMRISDDHDEERAIVRFGKGGALAASAFVFTIDGVPLLYEGMEAGDTAESGSPALFEKLPVFWKIAERRPEFPRFYASLIALRHAHPALQQGETVWLRNSDEARVVTYLRKGGGEEFLVAVNFSNTPFMGLVEAAAEGFRDVTPGVEPKQTVALPSVALDAWGFRIFQRTAR